MDSDALAQAQRVHPGVHGEVLHADTRSTTNGQGGQASLLLERLTTICPK